MSFILGPLTGGLVAGAIYYSFSSSIETRTKTLQTSLHQLSVELQDPKISKTAPAAEKIVYSPFRETLKHRWNEQVATGVAATRDFTVPWNEVWDRLKKVGH